MNQRQRLLEQIRQQSIQKRAQALKEAAQRQASNAPIVAAAAGAAGGGGGSAQCPPSAGIGLYLEFPLFDDLFGVGLLPLDYLGQQDGRPSYGTSIVPGEFDSRLQFDPEAGQWRGDFINGPDTFSTYSDQLVSSDWSEFNIPDIPIQVQQTTCGFPDLGRYCVTIPAFGVQAQPFPAWIGEPGVFLHFGSWDSASLVGCRHLIQKHLRDGLSLSKMLMNSSYQEAHRTSFH